jgi:hypothetical protein
VHHHRGHRGGALERRAAGEQGVEHAAQGVEVGAPVDPAAERLLGGEVLGGAHDGVGRRERLRAGRVGQLGDAEVEHAHPAVGGVGDVARLDVAVHQPAGVRGVERRGHLAAHLDDLVDRQRTVGQLVGQARPGQQLHDDVGGVALDAGVVHGDHVGVAQAGRRAGLALEASSPGLVAQGREVDGLDGHLAPEHGVGGTPDLAHAAAPDGGLEDVATGQSSLLAAHPRNPTGTPVACRTCWRP